MARYNNQKRYGKGKRNKGVKAGYREVWGYRGRWDETKLRKGLWKGRFRATKRRKARSYGSFGKGTKGEWFIWGKQKIIKTNKGEYQTIFDFYKKPIWFKVKKPRKNYYGRTRNYRRY